VERIRNNMASHSQFDADPEVETSMAEAKTPIDVPVEEDTEVPIAPVGASPDGGTRAWLQVLGSFLVFFNIWYQRPVMHRNEYVC